MSETPLLDVLAKADPNGQVVLHDGRIAFLRSDGRLVEVTVDKAAWGKDLPSHTSSRTASTATDNARFKPTSGALHRKAADQHTALSQVPAAGNQKQMSTYHGQAGAAHAASVNALTGKTPALHTKAANLHAKAGKTADSLASSNPGSATGKFFSNLSAAHGSLQKFHEGQAAGNSASAKPKSPGRAGFDRHFAQYD